MGYYGKNIVSASNIGRDNVDAFTLADSGFFRDVSPATSQSVSAVFNIQGDDGRIRELKQYKAFRRLLRKSQEVDDKEERRRRASGLPALAQKVLNAYDRKYANNPVPTINWDNN